MTTATTTTGNHVADMPGRRPLRSAGTNHLAVPPVKLTTVSNRAFSVVGLWIWNDMPEDVISAKSLSTFRQPNPLSDYSVDWTSPNLSL